jgi:hypothetical protein
MPIRPRYDDRERDATLFYQQMAFVSFFFPYPSGSEQPPPVPKVLWSWRYQYSARPRICPPLHHIPATRLATWPEIPRLFPTDESRHRWNWGYHKLLWGEPSIGNRCKEHKQYLQILCDKPKAFCRRLFSGYKICFGPWSVAVREALHAAKKPGPGCSATMRARGKVRPHPAEQQIYPATFVRSVPQHREDEQPAQGGSSRGLLSDRGPSEPCSSLAISCCKSYRSSSLKRSLIVMCAGTMSGWWRTAMSSAGSQRYKNTVTGCRRHPRKTSSHQSRTIFDRSGGLSVSCLTEVSLGKANRPQPQNAKGYIIPPI